MCYVLLHIANVLKLLDLGKIISKHNVESVGFFKCLCKDTKKERIKEELSSFVSRI